VKASDDPYGIAVERQLRQLAGRVGVADFVFKPVDRRKGVALREIGDFLLWVGPVVAVVSVKTRHPDSADTDDDDRKRQWLNKNIAKARRQIGGVVRTLRDLPPGELVLESERGVQVPWDPAAVTGYVGVILLDAEPPSGQYAPPVMSSPVPTIAVLSADWDFLHQVLPSTIAVINYAATRQWQLPSIPLGAEPDVFALLAENEGSGNPIVIPVAGLPQGHWRDVMAREPRLFSGALPEHRFARVIDVMVEGAADRDPEFSSTSSPTDYMRIVEFLDRIPMLLRVDVGKAVLDLCQQVGEGGGYKARLFGLPHGLMVALAHSGPRQDRSALLQSLTVARHSQALDSGAPASLLTVGVATEPIPSMGRSHDFFLVSGGIRSDPEFRAHRDELFGKPDLSQFLRMWEGPLRGRS
jgi:hypothetical protein